MICTRTVASFTLGQRGDVWKFCAGAARSTVLVRGVGHIADLALADLLQCGNHSGMRRQLCVLILAEPICVLVTGLKVFASGVRGRPRSILNHGAIASAPRR